MSDGTALQPEIDKLPGNEEADSVTCFVCKRKVEISSVVRMKHPKADDVWVCKDHVIQD